jgi:hypothetical protein
MMVLTLLALHQCHTLDPAGNALCCVCTGGIVSLASIPSTCCLLCWEGAVVTTLVLCARSVCVCSRRRAESTTTCSTPWWLVTMYMLASVWQRLLEVG